MCNSAVATEGHMTSEKHKKRYKMFMCAPWKLEAAKPRPQPHVWGPPGIAPGQPSADAQHLPPPHVWGPPGIQPGQRSADAQPPPPPHVWGPPGIQPGQRSADAQPLPPPHVRGPPGIKPGSDPSFHNYQQDPDQHNEAGNVDTIIARLEEAMDNAHNLLNLLRQARTAELNRLQPTNTAAAGQRPMNTATNEPGASSSASCPAQPSTSPSSSPRS